MILTLSTELFQIIFKNSVLATEKEQRVSIKKNQLVSVQGNYRCLL
jgi:hypothetical protein